MVKTSKRKIQWRSLDIDADSKSTEDPSAVKPHSELHPFLKIISKNMDAIVKKDSTQTSDDSKLVYLYRSDKGLESVHWKTNTVQTSTTTTKQQHN